MRFSLINNHETARNPVSGSWLQDHHGTLETAIKVATETEVANSNKIDVAMVESVTYGGPRWDHLIGLKRLDSRRVKA